MVSFLKQITRVFGNMKLSQLFSNDRDGEIKIPISYLKGNDFEILLLALNNLLKSVYPDYNGKVQTMAINFNDEEFFIQVSAEGGYSYIISDNLSLNESLNSKTAKELNDEITSLIKQNNVAIDASSYIRFVVKRIEGEYNNAYRKSIIDSYDDIEMV